MKDRRFCQGGRLPLNLTLVLKKCQVVTKPSLGLIYTDKLGGGRMLDKIGDVY